MERGPQFQQQMIPGTEHVTPKYNFDTSPPKGRVEEGSQLSMWIPHTSLVKALDEDKFKNAFEVPGGHPGGSRAYDEGRRETEQYQFGIPYEAPGEQRPVYGVLRQKDTLRYPHNDEPATPAYAGRRLYGNLLADIKPPHEDQDVTASHGDSMDESYALADTLSAERHTANSPDVYTEVQWHDRPSPREDIQAVHMTNDPMRGSQFLPNKDIGGPEHRARVGEARANAEQVARDLRLSGLRAPVYQWEKKVRYQPSLFAEDEGKRTEDWSRRQV